MTHKKWAFDRIDWDAEIRRDGISIDTEDYEQINTSEMVEILQLQGIRAHRGIPRAELVELLKSGERKKVNNPVDVLREKIMIFVNRHLDKIRDQMVLGCDGNCYGHHDMEVAVCYLASRKEIEGGD